MDESKIDEAATEAVLVFKDEPNLTYDDLVELAEQIKSTIEEFFNAR